jgi:hypothetical protein
MQRVGGRIIGYVALLRRGHENCRFDRRIGHLHLPKKNGRAPITACGRLTQLEITSKKEED